MRIHKAGFTLMELLVVLALTSILMTAIGGVLWQVSRGVGHAEQARTEALNIHVALEQFSQDVYAYKSDYASLADTELSFHIMKDDVDSLVPHGSLHAIKYTVETEDGVTSLKRTIRPLSLGVNPITSILWSAPNPEEKPLVFFGHRNAHTFLPLWNNERKSPLGVKLTITDANGEEWYRTVPILTGHGERL
ncbi:MAG: type II secretion system protein [Pseudomonadota bacterium]|nr:type II secretion system protein [Pseudomonadota bacterium]